MKECIFIAILVLIGLLWTVPGNLQSIRIQLELSNTLLERLPRQ